MQSDIPNKRIIPSGDSQSEEWLGIRAKEETEEDLEGRGSLSSLRPHTFQEYIGQEKVKENLLIACRAAASRGEPLDHLLFHGPPGLGKTSLSRIIASEIGVGFKATSGPIIEKPGDLAAILTSLNHRDILFIDEIHRLPRAVEEVLYPAMEDFHIDIMIGSGPGARTIQVDIRPFTLIGATTRTGLLTSPLRDRFGMVMRLNFYSPKEIEAIVLRSAGIMGVVIEDDAALEIATRSRGTPRIANRLLRRVRDFAEQKGDGKINLHITREALALLDIDEAGLDGMDRLILETIITKFNGGPVGVEAIAASIGEEKDTIEEVYEPFLLQEGLLVRTRRGREATEAAYKHLGIKYTPPQTTLPLR